MTNTPRTFGSHEWSPRERRLIGMSVEKPEPMPDPEFTKVDVTDASKAENIYDGVDQKQLIDLIDRAPQRIDAEQKAYERYALVKCMEEDGYQAFLKSSKKPRTTNEIAEYAHARNAALKNGPYQIGFTKGVLSIHPKASTQEHPELASLKARAAELDRQIGNLNGTIRKSQGAYKESAYALNPRTRKPVRVKAPNEGGVAVKEQNKQIMMDDIAMLGTLKKERADLQRQIDMLRGMPHQPERQPEAPEEAPKTPTKERSGTKRTVNIGSDAPRRSLDPQATRVIEKLPKELQAGVTRLYASIPSEADRNALIQGLKGFNELPDTSKQEVIGAAKKPKTQKETLSAEAKAFLSESPDTVTDVLADAAKEGQRILNDITVAEGSDREKKLQTLLEQYKNADTNEEKTIAEASMRMLSVDMQKSDLENGKIVLLEKQDKSRTWQALFGLIQMLGAVISKAYGKEKPLEKKSAKSPEKTVAKKSSGTEVKKEEEEWTTVPSVKKEAPATTAAPAEEKKMETVPVPTLTFDALKASLRKNTEQYFDARLTPEKLKEIAQGENVRSGDIETVVTRSQNAFKKQKVALLSAIDRAVQSEEKDGGYELVLKPEGTGLPTDTLVRMLNEIAPRGIVMREGKAGRVRSNLIRSEKKAADNL